MDILNTLKKMNEAFGPSGNESEISSVIAGMAREIYPSAEISSDVMGNLIVHIPGPGKKIMYSAHMDSIGLIVTHIEKEGILRFGRIGGIPETQVLGVQVRFKDGLCGVIYCNDLEDKHKVTYTDMYIDIGCNSYEEALKYVRPGDMCVYNTASYETPSGMIISPYTDNRSGCAVLLMAMEELASYEAAPENDLYFVFSSQEEVGLRGAKTAAFAINPDYGIAVDVTGADDIAKSRHGCSSSTGKGAAIKVKDGSVICDPGVVELLKNIAEERKIPHQMDVLLAGGTDAGVISLTKEGVRAGGISIPCKFCHCPQEMVSKTDMESCAKLAAAFAYSKLD